MYKQQRMAQVWGPLGQLPYGDCYHCPQPMA